MILNTFGDMSTVRLIGDLLPRLRQDPAPSDPLVQRHDQLRQSLDIGVVEWLLFVAVEDLTGEVELLCEIGVRVHQGEYVSRIVEVNRSGWMSRRFRRAAVDTGVTDA